MVKKFGGHRSSLVLFPHLTQLVFTSCKEGARFWQREGEWPPT